MTSFITKKLLPLLLCAAMVFGLLPVSAFAEEPESAEATEVSPVSDDQDNAPSVGDNQDNTTGDEAEPVTVSVKYANEEVIYATGLGLTGIKVWWNEDDWTSVLETYSAYDVALSGYTGGHRPHCP